MTFRNISISNGVFDNIRQFEQTDRIGHCHAALAHTLGYFFLGQPKIFSELTIRLRLLHAIQVCALNVFDQRQLEQFLIIGLARHHRDGFQARPLGCL